MLRNEIWSKVKVLIKKNSFSHLFLFSSCRGELVQPVSDLRQGAAADPAPPWRNPGDQVQWKWKALAPSLRLPKGQACRLLCSHTAGTQWNRKEELRRDFDMWLFFCFSVGEISVLDAEAAHAAAWFSQAEENRLFLKSFLLTCSPVLPHTHVYSHTEISSFISTLTKFWHSLSISTADSVVSGLFLSYIIWTQSWPQEIAADIAVYHRVFWLPFLGLLFTITWSSSAEFA